MAPLSWRPLRPIDGPAVINMYTSELCLYIDRVASVICRLYGGYMAAASSNCRPIDGPVIVVIRKAVIIDGPVIVVITFVQLMGLS